MLFNSTKKRIKLNKLTLQIQIVFLLSSIIFAIVGLGVDPSMQNNYFVLLIGYFVVGGLLSFKGLVQSIDVFEPLLLITLIYIMFFSISPMLDILTGNMHFFGYDVSGGTIKATIIYIGGYIAFFCGYSLKKNKSNTKNTLIIGKELNVKKIMYINMVLWMFGLLCSIIYLMSFGQSILYILSFGLGGKVQMNMFVGSPLAFLGMFTYAMVVPWLYLILHSKSIILRLIITFLTSSVYFVLGFRFIMLIMILAPCVFYYIKHKKRPAVTSIIVIFVVLVILIGLVGFVRGDARRGHEISWSEFGLEHIWYGIASNFEIYKSFYRMVEVIPEVHSYTMGKQLSYTLPIMIPRFFWPNKPDAPMRDVLRAVLGDYAVLAGTAWPNIGEYYSEFGVLGVLVLMHLFGMLCKASKKLYTCNNINIHNLIAYSVLLPTYIQIVIRGYTPTNFWLLFFFGVPILINSKISNK